MKLTVKVINVLPTVTGTKQNGETWYKNEFVGGYLNGDYVKHIAFTIWKDQTMPAVGDTVDVSFDVESKESNGRWFTECRAWKIEKV